MLIKLSKAQEATRKEMKMKKRIVIALLVAMMSVSVTACGNGSKDATEATEQAASTKRSGEFDLDLSKLVSDIPDYSKLELDIDSEYEVTDDAINEYLTNAILQFGGDAYKENKDKDVVEKTDYVKVDYTGYKDDKAFDNGSAKDVLIDVENNKQVGQTTGFIDGFSEGLVGAKVGDTIKCPVTFPKNYSANTDLAGQKVVFEFVIKGIYTKDPVTVDDLTDKEVNKIFSEAKVTTKEELKMQLKSDLDNNLYNKEVEQAKKYMIENAKVEIPDDYFNARYSEYIKSLEDEYSSATQTLKEVVESSGSGMTYDDYVKLWKENLTNQIKVELVFGRIAELEDVKMDDDEFSQYISYVISQSNGSFADEKAVYEYFGAGNETEGKEYMQRQYLVNKAVDIVAANVTPKFVDSSADTSSDATEAPEGTETK